MQKLLFVAFVVWMVVWLLLAAFMLLSKKQIPEVQQVHDLQNTLGPAWVFVAVLVSCAAWPLALSKMLKEENKR